MNPGVSAKVSKSDIRVPERKSKVSKCELFSQSRNLSIVQKQKLLSRTSEKKKNSLHKLWQPALLHLEAMLTHTTSEHLIFFKSHLDEVDQTNMSCFLGGSR